MAAVQLPLAPDADRCFTALQLSRSPRAVGAGEARTLGADMRDKAAAAAIVMVVMITFGPSIVIIDERARWNYFVDAVLIRDIDVGMTPAAVRRRIQMRPEVTHEGDEQLNQLGRHDCGAFSYAWVYNSGRAYRAVFFDASDRVVCTTIYFATHR